MIRSDWILRSNDATIQRLAANDPEALKVAPARKRARRPEHDPHFRSKQCREDRHARCLSVHCRCLCHVVSEADRKQFFLRRRKP